MRICRLIIYDIKQGFYQNRRRYVGIMVLVLASCLDFYIRKGDAFNKGGTTSLNGSFMDYLFYLVGGMKEYKPGINAIFVFPAKWFLLHLFLLYCTLYYPYRDLLSSAGSNILVRSKKRREWWISKCIWNIMFLFCAYVLIYLTIALFCFFTNETFSVQLTPELLLSVMDMETNTQIFPPELSLYVTVAPLAVSIALSLLQMTVTLFIKPIFSFGLSALILLSSAYLLSPWMVGNYAMPMRSEYIVDGGVGFTEGLFICGIIFGVSIVVGTIAFCHYDILQVSEL